MTAGLNMWGRVWHITFPTDDEVGGAEVTGTVAYDGVHARMTPKANNPLLLEQGIETDTLFNLEVRPPSMIIYERDEWETTFPLNHWTYGKRFRIVSVQYPSVHPDDSRGFINLVLKRRERAHAQQ